MNVDFNANTDHIDIPLNRYGLIGYLPLIFGGLVLGVLFLITPTTFVTSGYRYSSPVTIFIMGLCLAISCGPVFIIMCYKVIVNKPGLSITEEGIVDNSTTAASGFFNWADIVKFTHEDSNYPVCIIVHLKDTEQYLKKQRNIFKRYFASNNEKTYGSPMVINTYQLKCDFIELKTFLDDTLKIYNENLGDE
jgi:hypothetical protein